MKIEAVTVCVNYTTSLSKTLSNKDKFNRWVVVTVKSDLSTRWLCRQHGIECILTDRLYDNAQFAKGRAINDGLKELDRDSWLVHIDSDTLLPDDFRSVVERDVSDKDYLYYTRRYSSDGIDVDQYKFDTSGPTPIYNIPEVYRELNEQHGLPLEKPETYVHKPYGFFQLWHSSQRDDYYEISSNADVDDIYMSYSFYPKWYLLPLRITDMNPFCSNWDGSGDK